MDDSFREKAKPIRMLLMDVDGVLTDGTFERHGDEETKRFHARDGIGLVLARRAGIKLGLISGRASRVVEDRARELQMHFLRLGVSDKLASLDEATAEHALKREEVAFMGDDFPDLPVLTRVGLSATVADAPLEIRSQVDYVTRADGGKGAVREVIEQLLMAKQVWDDLIRQYSR